MPRIEMTPTTNTDQQEGISKAVENRRQMEERSFPGVGSLADVRKEIDEALEDMRGFFNQEPDEVMRRVSGHSARLVELRVGVQRVEDAWPMWKLLRTRELEPVLDELKNQFQIASRVHSVRQLDWEMSKGQGV